ncbi:UNVERIFIED_CONTAM: hypothetical protein Slati_0908400 [Sesamum latifolium]|uniref:Uncharacterized protein n=1 Tax=Sesamum latifolium TaxID=2727402 RepID=A0AAW2XNQ3_9LAMI
MENEREIDGGGGRGEEGEGAAGLGDGAREGRIGQWGWPMGLGRGTDRAMGLGDGAGEEGRGWAGHGVTGGLSCLAAEYIFHPCGVSCFTQPSTRLRTSQSLPTVCRVSSTLKLASMTSERIPARHRVPVRSPIRNAHVHPRLSARSP